MQNKGYRHSYNIRWNPINQEIIQRYLVMNQNLPDNQTNFILYTGNYGEVNLDVLLKDETIWLTRKGIGKLFGKSKATISEHLKNIYAIGELKLVSTVRNFRTVQTEGSRQVQRDLEFYNLDAIISVGYRVNSYQATQFRIWATRTLKEYIIKGFVLDDKRLKQGNPGFIGNIVGKPGYRYLYGRNIVPGKVLGV